MSWKVSNLLANMANFSPTSCVKRDQGLPFGGTLRQGLSRAYVALVLSVLAAGPSVSLPFQGQ